MLKLLQRTRSMGIAPSSGTNLIAFSGGVDSSVVAAALFHIFPQNSLCVIGRSQSLPENQLQIARKIALHIGIPLKEITTSEGASEQYLLNEGMSCYSCKSHLYQAFIDIKNNVDVVKDASKEVRIFNGTNKDDTSDLSRVGLIAAREFKVFSPLDEMTKAEVRECAKEFGLPNHSFAASPCLRSRLALGVRATSDNLRRIEEAEEVVREVLLPEPHHNIRVRHMKGGSARVEMDPELLVLRADTFPSLAQAVASKGFSTVEFHVFKSGGLALKLETKLAKEDNR